MAALKVKIGADTTALGSGMRRARGLVGGFGKSLSKLGVGRAVVGLGALAGGFLGVRASLRGLKGAIDLGGSLSDLSSRTGVAVRELVVLKRAFQDNGIAGEKVGPVINKMQKAITDAGAGLSTQVRAFDRLGISFEDLEGKSPAEQFEMIQRGLTALEDPTLRAGTAMDIFGRSGGELQALFDDDQALGKAAESVGKQAEILEDNAAAFDRTSDLLAGMGDKLRGFFVGVMDYINPVLLPVLERLNEIDLAAYGQAVGRFVAAVVEAFSSGEVWSILATGLTIAGKGFINTMVVGFRAVVAMVWEGLKGIPELFSKVTSVLLDVNLWKSVGKSLKAALSEGMADLAALVGRDEAAAQLRSSADTARTMADMHRRFLADTSLRDLVESGAGVITGMADAFREQWERDGPLEMGADLKALDASMDRLRESVERADAAEEERFKGKGKQVVPELPVVPKTPQLRPQAPRVQSLARVGGAAITRRSVDLAQERNGILRRIERNTGRRMAAVYA